jgi:hypothetical protein
MQGTELARTTRRLPASSSLLLDVVRFGAPVMVAVGHIICLRIAGSIQSKRGPGNLDIVDE